jgi:SAM-dependent methyltransferase
MSEIHPVNTPSHYDELVARQIDQYKDTEVMHDLPGIFDYWSSRYNDRQAASVTGFRGLIELYAGNFQRSLHESDSVFLGSVGSGDCWLEIEIVKYLIAKNERNFFFICLELSPILIEKARKKIDEQGLGDVITVAQIDINKWEPKYSFAGVMAHHSLHHFLNLEQLFSLIKKNLAPHGRFVTCDIIGRNGHMRWPEALILTRKIWDRLPRKYKYNHQFRRYEDYYNNFDCSTEGFEGIRAQDILPLLVTQFSFEVFFSHGNLIDPFIDRNFGPNYDPNNANDTAFIDFLVQLNEKLISDGILKPTSMAAVMVNEPVPNPSVHAHWTPAFAVRDPEAPTPVYDVDVLLKDMPLQAAREDDPLLINKVKGYSPGQKMVFVNAANLARKTGIDGVQYLTYGWGSPEEDFTWSTCEDAGLLLPLQQVAGSPLQLSLDFIPYQSPLYPHTLIDIWVNGQKVGSAQYDNKIQAGVSSVTIQIPAAIIAGKHQIEISLMFPNRRQPQYEPGEDIRSLGIALLSAKIS